MFPGSSTVNTAEAHDDDEENFSFRNGDDRTRRPASVLEWLLSRHRIVSTPIVHPEFNGVRVTPNVYTTVDEIDVFADKMLDAIKRGIA